MGGDGGRWCYTYLIEKCKVIITILFDCFLTHLILSNSPAYGIKHVGRESVGCILDDGRTATGLEQNLKRLNICQVVLNELCNGKDVYIHN